VTQVFSLDDGSIFAPIDIDVEVTPQAVTRCIARNEFGQALNMALHLAEPTVLKRAVDSVPYAAVPLVVKTIDVAFLKPFLRFIAEQIVSVACEVVSVCGVDRPYISPYSCRFSLFLAC